MSAFSPAQRAYLAERRLGRLATVDSAGLPHVVPLGWSYNAALDTIDISGRDFARTAKYHNAAANPNVALVIDDVLPPWRPRAIMIRGHAQALADGRDASGRSLGAIVRIHALQILSWGLEAAATPAADR